MNKSLVIRNYWASNAENSFTAIEELKQKLTQLNSIPAIVTLVSAGEVNPLLEPVVMEFYFWLKKQTSIQFISAACVSLHGALLEFSNSKRENGLIIILELSQDIQQACLNSLGVGIEPEQDGLTVVAGVGCVQVSRKYLNGDLVVKDCQIFSQPLGLSGISFVINQLTEYLSGVESDVIPVSFNIQSCWGKKLLKGLTSKPQISQAIQSWLPSFEESGLHYLSLKPLHELIKYKSKLDTHSLLIITLGGGGRVGCLHLSGDKTSTSNLTKASFNRYSLDDDLDSYRQAAKLKVNNHDEFYQQIRTTLKYPRAQYRGIHNHYFQWELS